MITIEDAAARARTEAETRGWPWPEPVFAIVRARWILFGPLEWHVTAGGADPRVQVVLDAASGRVTAARRV